MSRRVSALSMLAFALLATSSLLSQKTLTATEAKAHVGEHATVCGKVVSTRWAESSRGSPTFLNFDQALSRPGLYAGHLGQRPLKV